MLALKGVVLSVQLHDDPHLRGARDIDLLLDPEQFARAKTLLARSGYQRVDQTRSARQSAAHHRWVKDVQFIHAASGVPLEVHHRLTDDPGLLECDFETLWRDREEISLDGNAVATLSRAWLPLYLCIHGGGHGWERLRWLMDFTAALEEPGRVDAALAAAEAAGITTAMLHACMLAHDWLGLPLANRHLARARACPQVARLDRILAHLYDGPAWYQMPRRGSLAGLPRYSLWQRLYRISLKPGWRYRTRQGMREFISPADWDTLRLPDALFWAYPLLRPIGWLLRRGRR